MERDGIRKSLWQHLSPYSPRRQSNTIRYEVIIVGGGITGLAIALRLQKFGIHCVVLEAQNLGFGTTGGTTAHLNTLLDTPYQQIIDNFGLETAVEVRKAAEEALQLIKSQVNEYAIDCEFNEEPAYLFARDPQQVRELDSIADACRKVGLNCSFVNHLPISVPSLKVLKIDNQAKFHPLIYLHGIAAEFEKAGGTIKLHSRVQRVKSRRNSVEVFTAENKFVADALIYATHIPPGINLLHSRCSPWRSYAVAVELSDQNYPSGLCYDMYDPYHYYRTQYVDQKPYLIVGGEDHRTGQSANTENCFPRLVSHIRNYFKVSRTVCQWSSQYFESTDGLPFIGNLPGHNKNIYVATGFGGNGMTFSAVAARVISSMITKQSLSYQKVFRPGRVKPIAELKEFVNHNAEIAKQFIQRWIPIEKLTSFDSLVSGEGQVVRYEGQEIAVSKDKDGVLFAVSPICSHMKCIVKWNLAEQTWECPCHGARYRPDGTMITGPAIDDLVPIAIGRPTEA